MKNSMKVLVKNYPILFILGLLVGCGGGDGNTGSNVTEIDSAEDLEALPEINSENYAGDLNPGSAVNVELDENSTFNWTDFRNQLQAQPEAIGEGFHMGDNEVTSAWEPLNERYSYQTRYLYMDNELWLQTYYRENSQDANADGQILTKDQEDSNLQELWRNMEEMANDLKSKLEGG